MKNVFWMLTLALVAALMSGRALAADEKTVTGKSACAHCSGTIDGGCALMLTATDGTKWVLRGDSDSYKAAMKARTEGKTMTATLAGDAVTKKGADGKEYKEAKVSDVKIDA
jgi:hypothetical protein